MRTILLLLLFIGGLQAQKGHPGHLTPEPLPQPSRLQQWQSPAPGSAAEARESSQLLYPGGAYDFRPGGQRKSQTAEYWDYAITFREIPLYGLYATAKKRSAEKVRWTFPHLPQEPDPELHAAAPQLDREKSSEKIEILSPPEQAWIVRDNSLQPAWRYRLHNRESGATDEILVNQGEVLYQRDLRRFKDSTVSGMVFYPDPLTSADKFYGGVFVDQNDGDSPVLNNERQSVTFTADFRQDTFYLEHPRVKLQDLTPPNVPVLQGSNTNLNFTRSQSEFEDVNVFFHLTNFYAYTQQLGYGNIPAQQIKVDPHGASGNDQSFYIPSTKELNFGEGGVDDGEDADVIIHEWTHAMVDAAASPGNRSIERSTLEEALADYFAYSYTKALVPNQTDRIFNWDGHNFFWPGRDARSLKDYTQIQFNQSIYQHTDLMVSCLAEIESNLGPQVADELVLESLFGLKGNTSFADFAYEMLAADSALNGAQNRQVIVEAFIRRSVLPASINLPERSAEPEIYLSQSGAKGLRTKATLHSSAKLEKVTLRSVDGKVLRSIPGLQRSRITIDLDQLPQGLYLVEVRTGKGSTRIFKALRP